MNHYTFKATLEVTFTHDETGFYFTLKGERIYSDNPRFTLFAAMLPKRPRKQILPETSKP